MRKRVNHVAWKVLAGSAAFWIGLHAVAGQHPTHHWYDVVLYVLAGSSAAAYLLTTDRAISPFIKKPKLVLGEVRAFRRTAAASRGDEADLVVVYAKLRNAQDGGGDNATMFDSEAWMSAVDSADNEIARCQGNWLSLRGGIPDPNPQKKASLRPTGEEIGLEIIGKFTWGSDAWLAGEITPSLGPGRYRIRAAISDGIRKAETFEWDVENRGADDGLVVDGKLFTEEPRQAPYVLSALPLPGTAIPVVTSSASTASSSATAADWTPRKSIALTVVSAIYGSSPEKSADVRERLNSLIADDYLDFIADNVTLVPDKDPAPGEVKTLRLRWEVGGDSFASAFTEGTHVVIPSP